MEEELLGERVAFYATAAELRAAEQLSIIQRSEAESAAEARVAHEMQVFAYFFLHPLLHTFLEW